MKVKIKLNARIATEFGIVGLPIAGNGKRYMLMLTPDIKLLSPNEQQVFTPVDEVILDKESLTRSILEDPKFDIEEVPQGSEKSKKDVK